MNCPICNGKMKNTMERYTFSGVDLGSFGADKCENCGEVFFSEEASDKIDAKAKELGLWGIQGESKIGYSGNSLIVRVPKKIAEFLKFKKGEKVSVRPEGKNRLVVEIR